MRSKLHPRCVDHAVAELATRQGGVVSRAQLLEVGLSSAAIGRRLAAGRLHAVPGHRGVFFVGHVARGGRTKLWAAHLAIGPSSVISHRSAADLWGLRRTAITYVELTVPGPSRRRSAIRVHRTTWLPAADVAAIDGLPVTSVARTLLDLGAVAPRRVVERAFDEADARRLLDMTEIGRVLQEGERRPGAPKLGTVVARAGAGAALTETDLEELMLAIIRRAGLPEPVGQYPVLGYRPDFAWPRHRLIAEADGPWHDTPAGREHDARRDIALQNAGWRVLRFPRRVILGDPAYVADALESALAPAVVRDRTRGLSG
jgi:very-short-patch-repair endonuclease